MDKLLRNVKKELEHIAEEGLNGSNLEATYKLVDIAKDIGEIQEQEEKREMRGYRSYTDYDNYPSRGFSTSERDRYPDYDRRSYNPERGYKTDNRMGRNIERLIDGSEMYRYGKDRYMGGGNKEQMNEGLENMMYAICTLVEGLIDTAETAEEKDIIHKHIKKLSNI